MTLSDYVEHYLVWKNVLIFLGEALGGLAICLLILILLIKIMSLSAANRNKNAIFRNHLANSVDKFYEIIFAGASILSFLSVYYLINRFLEIQPYREFWDKYKDFILLLLICLSIIINNLLDRVLIPLKNISKEERASIRITGMIYVILIFIYIKFIYENNNYDGFIMYFLGIMIGRFVYFDASFKETMHNIKNAILNIPMMILGLMYTGFMCYLGFKSGYLKILNGVLVSTFIAHIFMIISIAFVYHCRIMTIFTKKRR